MTNEQRRGVIGGMVRKHHLPIAADWSEDTVLRCLLTLEFKRMQAFHITRDTVGEYLQQGRR
jgi:hypothetical protein